MEAVMNLRISTARATRLVLALLLSSAATAAAQQTTRADSTRKPGSADSMRVRKDAGTRTSPGVPVAKEPIPVPDTTTMLPPVTPPTPPPVTPPPVTMPVDTAPTPVVTTTSGGEAIPMPPKPPSRNRFGNGFYVGVAGGASFPRTT
jgi:hypothetical protein